MSSVQVPTQEIATVAQTKICHAGDSKPDVVLIAFVFGVFDVLHDFSQSGLNIAILARQTVSSWEAGLFENETAKQAIFDFSGKDIVAALCAREMSVICTSTP